MASELIPLKNKLAILAAGLLSFIGILVETSMNVTFPTLMRTMHVNIATVQWLTTAYLLAVTIVMSATAFLLKRYSFRHLFLLSVLMCLLGSICAMTAQSFSMLLAGRLLQAVATGISTPLMFQLVFTRIPHDQVGLYTGFASVIVSLAPALGPTYGGVLTSLWSWRAIFIGIVPLIVIVGLLGAYAIHGAALSTHGQRFDLAGMVLLALTFASIVLTFNNGGEHGFLSVQFVIGVAISLVLGLAFDKYAQHGHRHLFDYHILRSIRLRQRLLQYFGLQFINISLSFVLPVFAQDVLHASPMASGLMLLPGAIVGAIFSPIAGKIYDRRGPNLPLILSAACAALALALFAGSTRILSVGSIGLFYTLLRIGFNTGFGTAVADASTTVTGRQKADQNAMFSMMQQFAGSLGTSVMAAVIAAAALRQPATQATISGSQVDFGLLLAFALILLVSAILVRKLSANHN